MFVTGGKMWRPLLMALILALSGLILIGCTAAPAAEPTSVAEVHDDDHHDDDHHDDEHGHDHDDDHAHDDDDDHAHDHDDDHHHHGEHELSLPELSPVALAAGEKLRVVATTSIIGDVVAQVGGDAIQLTVLMGAGQDPHSYAPSAAQLTAVARAHVIFVNGWDLEERLLRDLENIAEGLAPLIPVSAYVDPLEYGEGGHHHDDEAHHDDDEHAHDDDHDHGPIDPHTWFDVRNVIQWVDNILHVLEDLDPANEELYGANAEAYIAELRALDEYIRDQIRPIPQENRKLVTSHDSLGYFGRAYGFEIIGTLIPGLSTMAEPSASDLAAPIREMREEGVCAIFVETIASDRLGQVVAGELTGCANVQVLTLYTDALGEPGSGADSYIGMMRANVDTIVSALK